MMELITTSFFVFSSIYGGPTGAIADTSATGTAVTPQVAEQASTTAKIPTNEGIEQEAKAYFKNTPILADIAFCESTFRQYDTDGKPLRGVINKGDIGVMQINEYYQGDKAKALGYDLDTPEGNMAYAKYLYEKEGTKPWSSSETCWGADEASASSSNQVAMK